MTARWIAADWGTSNLRAWAIQGAEVVAAASSDQGMGALEPAGFEAVFLDLVGAWVDGPTQVIICGMAGARQGWAEAPYAPVPARPLGAAGMVAARAGDPRLAVWIVPGLSQTDPADVIRGEETQIAGFLARDPGFDGVVCLPGTHTKWARISAGEVCHFATAMSGEIFALLAAHSVLRHSVGEGWDADAFSEAVDSAYGRPQRLAGELFAIRAQGLLGGEAPGRARARLSGLLIGAELAAMKPYWLGQNVALIGDAQLTSIYRTALETLGVGTETMDGQEAALAGLIAARMVLNGGAP